MKSQRWLVWMMRVAIGAVFIASGFVKGVDPFGSLYKFREYLTALGMWLPDSVLLTGVIALCAFEFMLGIFLALGCYRRGAPRLALALMSFMLILTAWIAFADPVSDCGCFGDALVLSNWATFIKNIVITAGVVYLVKMNLEAPCMVSPYLQWLVFLGGAVYIVCISLYGYEIQPPVDFRPFPTGSVLAGEDGETDDEAASMTFIYARGDEISEVSASDPQPDESEGWTFVERREKSAENSGNGSTLHIYTDDEEDATHDILDGQKSLLILIPELERVSKSDAWKIERLVAEARDENMVPACIVAGSDHALRIWKDLLDPSVPLYKAEDTVLKMVARGNPAVVLSDNGKIVWKATMRSLPIEDSKGWIGKYYRDDRDMLRLLSSVLIAWLGLLALASHLRAFRIPGKRFRKNPVQAEE